MNNFSDRQLFDVDVNCAKCGTHISQLPFQPSGDRPVYCQECNRSFRDTRRTQERKMYAVNVNCAGCGVAITQLPFLPKDGSDIFCRDCYLKNKVAA